MDVAAALKAYHQEWEPGQSSSLWALILKFKHDPLWHADLADKILFHANKALGGHGVEIGRAHV